MNNDIYESSLHIKHICAESRRRVQRQYFMFYVRQIAIVILFLLSIWFSGLMFVLVYYGMGGEGLDLLSNHYRSVIMWVISLFV